jgi:hypothetical protein
MLHRYSHHDKQWLSQSNYSGSLQPATPEALRLAESLINFAATAGWGFHLLCNLSSTSGLDLQHGRARELAELAIEGAARGDPGLVTAVLAYAPANAFRKRLRARRLRLEEDEMYLEALANGIRWAEVDVGPPRFRYIHDPAAVIETINLGRHLHEKLEPERKEPTKLAEHLWTAARDVMAGASIDQRREVARRIGRVERGDYRPLAFARGAASDPDPYAMVVKIWRAQISSRDDERLFP